MRRTLQHLILSWLVVGTAFAFSPATSRRAALTTTLSVSALEEVDSTGMALDPFDAYQQTDEQRTVEVRDLVVGSGAKADKDMLVKVAFSGRLMKNRAQFDEGEYVFKLGESRVVPGWEKGIPVCTSGLIW